MDVSLTLEQLRAAALKNWSAGNFGKIAVFAVKGGEDETMIESEYLEIIGVRR